MLVIVDGSFTDSNPHALNASVLIVVSPLLNVTADNDLHDSNAYEPIVVILDGISSVCNPQEAKVLVSILLNCDGNTTELNCEQL